MYNYYLLTLRLAFATSIEPGQSVHSGIHLLYLELSIIIFRDIKMRTWSWSANSIEPVQNAWKCRLAWSSIEFDVKLTISFPYTLSDTSVKYIYSSTKLSQLLKPFKSVLYRSDLSLTISPRLKKTMDHRTPAIIKKLSRAFSFTELNRELKNANSSSNKSCYKSVRLFIDMLLGLVHKSKCLKQHTHF